MDAARAFLNRFRAADAEGAPLAAFADDPDGLAAVLADDPDALGAALAGAVDARHGGPVAINRDCFASAAIDGEGRVVVADARFAAWFDDSDPFDTAVRGIAGGAPRVTLFADDRSGRPVALAAGGLAVARAWPLDEGVVAALTSRRARFAVVAFRAGSAAGVQAVETFRLTQAEASLVAALARHGDLQLAADARGIAYETARKFVAAAMRKTGTRRQTDLIRRTLAAAAGELPGVEALTPLLRELFGLTRRQAELAVHVAGGATRDEAAARLNISIHRAKADLKTVFVACGIASAVDLARLIAEVEALHGLATACDVSITARGGSREPLRLVARRWAGGVIAVADHGPADGAPVVVLHSNVSGRHHSASFIAGLQAAGYRPIAVERGGYGLTDPAPGDPVVAAANDLDDVLDALRLRQVAAVARCTTASFVACASAARGRITGGVLVWPDGPAHGAGARMTDRVRSIFTAHPALAEGFARLVARRSGGAVIAKLWRVSAAGVPSDLAVLDDPREVADIVRGTLQACAGMTGFLGEALALAARPLPVRVPASRRWTLLFGTGYERHDVADAVAFWSAALPQATVRIVDDGVHFLHVTHGAEVVAALGRAALPPSLTHAQPSAMRPAHDLSPAFARGGQG
ncbi:alpha/beta fold hydrolase [Glacieibacterium frigidum]|uniref:HTH luxR-type domain-containing protein n=1 Tax=Glacieibacterium frigidum TaxID=2593303 RepID=A0A552UAH5_9SPHN|nr:alpha/beta fold hydrolase [Glacieibacterium frigidum]TRW15214.1 hypothetical protein FMM06_16430 [Glacieibacterium frigidum]